MTDEMPPVSPELTADGWETFELEGPIYENDRVIVKKATVRGIRKTFTLLAKPRDPEK